MADLGETFDGSVSMEIGGDLRLCARRSNPQPLDGRAIFANMASRFGGAPLSPHARCATDSLKTPTSVRYSTEARSTRARSSASRNCARISNGWLGAPTAARRDEANQAANHPHKGLGASHAKPRIGEATSGQSVRRAPQVRWRRLRADPRRTTTPASTLINVAIRKQASSTNGPTTSFRWQRPIGKPARAGTGLSAFVRGKIQKTVKCDTAHVEVYRSLRYLT